MSVNVEVVEETTLPPDASPETLAPLVHYVLLAEGQSGEWDVSIALVSDGALQRLHRDFMGIDTVTDVMTFPREPDSWGSSLGGDIAISVDRAADHAAELGGTTWDEVRFLAVHGTLHLCGWDDGDDRSRSRMLERQRILIAAFDDRAR